MKVVLMSTVIATSGVFIIPGQVLEPTTVLAAPGQSEAAHDQKVIAPISEKRMYADVYHLSETIGPRVTGTEEEREAASFIRNRLQSYGYEVEVQEFRIPDKMIGHLQTSAGDEVLINIPAGSASTASEGLTAQLYDAGLGYANDFTAESAGKIALISRGDFTFQEKVENAYAAGAVGVLIYNNIESPGPLNPSIGEASIPVGGISKASGEALIADVVRNDGTVTLKVDALTDVKSQNIIATRAPKKEITMRFCTFLHILTAYHLHQAQMITHLELRLR